MSSRLFPREIPIELQRGRTLTSMLATMVVSALLLVLAPPTPAQPQEFVPYRQYFDHGRAPAKRSCRTDRGPNHHWRGRLLHRRSRGQRQDGLAPQVRPAQVRIGSKRARGDRGGAHHVVAGSQRYSTAGQSGNLVHHVPRRHENQWSRPPARASRAWLRLGAGPWRVWRHACLSSPIPSQSGKRHAGERKC